MNCIPLIIINKIQSFHREQAEAMNRVVVMVAEGEVDKKPKGKEVEVKGEEVTVAKREKAEGWEEGEAKREDEVIQKEEGGMLMDPVSKGLGVMSSTKLLQKVAMHIDF